MSLRNTTEYYKQAKYLHKVIDEVFSDFEEGRVQDLKVDATVSKALKDINRLNNTLNKIHIEDFNQIYNPDEVELIENNVDFMYEAADYIEKYLLGKKYHDSVMQGVTTYFKSMGLYTGDFKRYASDLEEYTKKFVGTLLHPNNIKQFINQIKRIGLGTMSLKEFKKIYATIKPKMLRLPTSQFESFKEYNEQYEA